VGVRPSSLARTDGGSSLVLANGDKHGRRDNSKEAQRVTAFLVARLVFSALPLRLLRKLGENRRGIGNVSWSREYYRSHYTASEPELARTKQA
jgi:hypothetical protein